MKQVIFASLLFFSLNLFGQGLTRKVLFLGNSFTSVNNLPLMVSELAATTGDVLIYDSHLPGGYTLQDHFSNATSLAKIGADDWDYIILQEQSQRPAFINPNSFMSGFGQLEDYIEQTTPCAQVGAYMTWGYENGDAQNCASNPAVCTYTGMQDLVSDRYMNISNLFEAEVTPVGVVWKYIRENHPSIDLYQADGSHPSLAGSYLAACCFYASLFQKDPTLITSDYGLDSGTASILRNASKLLVFDDLLTWYIGKYTPYAAFNFTIGTGLNEVNCQAVALSDYYDSLVWNFGDGTVLTALNPTHNYAADGNYTIQLTAYRCYLGETLESVTEKTVNFCPHNNTIYPDLLLCPDDTDTIWTQPADTYQWYDFYGDAIPGATEQYLVVGPGEYTVLTTIGGCAEYAPQIYVDSYMDNPDCYLEVIEPDNDKAIRLFPNPVQTVLTVESEENIDQLVFFDLTGNEVLQVSHHEVDVSRLARGSYLVKAITAEGTIRLMRFVKQ